MAANIVELSGVHKHYGTVRAVDGVDLDLPAGGIIGLIGRNGAGKSTLFKMMLGLTPPSAGAIRIGGEPVTGGSFREVRRTIGYMPENAAFYENLTGLETLEYFAALKGADRAQCPRLLERIGLHAAGSRRLRGYSKGMRQRMALAQALLGRPRLLFLDEPTNGLDPQGVHEFYTILQEVRSQGGTVILTSHILAEIQDRVDLLVIMRLGRIQAMGTLAALRQSTQLPLSLVIVPRPDAIETVRSAVAALGLGAVITAQGNLCVECPPERKMPLLQKLSELRGTIVDLQIREPSLEDVFLGYGGAAQA